DSVAARVPASVRHASVGAPSCQRPASAPNHEGKKLEDHAGDFGSSMMSSKPSVRSLGKRVMSFARSIKITSSKPIGYIVRGTVGANDTGHVARKKTTNTI